MAARTAERAPVKPSFAVRWDMARLTWVDLGPSPFLAPSEVSSLVSTDSAMVAVYALREERNEYGAPLLWEGGVAVCPLRSN